MSRLNRFVALLVGVVLTLTLAYGANARIRTVIREPFNGTAPELGHRWHDIDGDWRRGKGSARIVEGSVSAQTNVAYSVRELQSSYGKRGLAVTSKVRLSPGWANIGIVGHSAALATTCSARSSGPSPIPKASLRSDAGSMVTSRRSLRTRTRSGSSAVIATS